MSHILEGAWLFIGAVFGRWQIWLSGGGIGGVIVIAATLIEKVTGRSLSKKAHVAIFLIGFFLCSCLLAWIDEHDHSVNLQSEVGTAHGQLVSQSIMLNSQIARCREDVAGKDGISQTLQKQNRDQQATINGCLTQAMKLLTPEAQKTTALLFDSEGPTDGVRKTRWILLTNKPVTPVRMAIQCTARIEAINIFPIGSASMASGSGRLAVNVMEQSVSSPAWTPTLPFLAAVSYRGGEDVVCSFILR